MADSTIPVDLLNPGQVFACLGILELTDMLLGDAAAAFDWDGKHGTMFRVAAADTEPPVERVMRFFEEARIVARAPKNSPNLNSWNANWGELEEGKSGEPFPFPDPDKPPTLPAVLRDDAGNEATLDYWGDATRRDNVKFWAGARGTPGVAILRVALKSVRGKLAQHASNPFALSEPQTISFRFDWRRDYIPVQDGFSPNNHKSGVLPMSMVGYPLVEILAAFGMTHARPSRNTKLEYRYGVLGYDGVRRRIDSARVADEAKGGMERSCEEMRASVAVIQTLRHAGVRVSPLEVRVQREPFERRGVRAESFASGTRFSKDKLWHAAVTFAEPVAGPLLLGDGRYLGLGLMLPDKRTPGVLAFTIEAGLADSANSGLVTRAARRAMMARVQANLPRGESLPTYVSGHDENGRPAGGGHHCHVAVVADLPRQRLLYIAPNRLQRQSVRWRDIAADHRRTAFALEGMDILRAGKAGRLVLASAVLDEDTDPLFAGSRVWHSVTDYCVTRHRRRLTDDEALKVLTVHRGPRGGLSGQLQLAFATAQTGPLVIGRTAHKGGGLFASDN